MAPAASYEAVSETPNWSGDQPAKARAARPMSSFFSPYRHQFVRVGACVPQVAVAEPARNGDQALALLARRRRGGDRADGVSRAVAVGLFDRRSAVPGRGARRGRGADRAAGRGKREPAFRSSSSGRRCGGRGGSTIARSRSTAAGCSESCRKSFCRITANSTSGGISPPARACAADRSPSPGTRRRSART